MRVGSSQTVPASVLPNFVPGGRRHQRHHQAVRLLSPAACRIRSIPAVMLPHWSLPPICSVQPYRSKSCRKSYACSSR